MFTALNRICELVIKYLGVEISPLTGESWRLCVEISPLSGES